MQAGQDVVLNLGAQEEQVAAAGRSAQERRSPLVPPAGEADVILEDAGLGIALVDDVLEQIQSRNGAALGAVLVQKVFAIRQLIDAETLQTLPDVSRRTVKGRPATHVRESGRFQLPAAALQSLRPAIEIDQKGRCVQ
jgi:hypothetical protein|nr:hypothetical protein [Cyanobium sp. Cruz CV13-4-11]